MIIFHIFLLTHNFILLENILEIEMKNKLLIIQKIIEKLILIIYLHT